MTDLPPGPELDRAVAEKVMGWCERINLGLNVFADDKGNLRATTSNHGYMAPQFSPSTNIAHAWEVMEQMEKSDHDFVLRGSREGRWVAGWVHYRSELNDYHAAKGDTPELAICRAALKAVES